jgi:DNA polymerase-3 subunit epsilon
MTRGQESLAMDLGGSGDAAQADIRIDSSSLIVLAPTDEELAAHEKILDAIDKQAKGGSIWRRPAN